MPAAAANPSPFDPLDRLEPEEDRFVIREKDPCGPPTITEWCRLRRNRAAKLYGTNPVGDAKRLLDAELAQCAEAEEKALEWSARQAGAAEEGAKATYADVALTEEQVAKAKRQKDFDAVRRHLREAAYHAAEIVEADGADELECFAPVLGVLGVVNQLADGLDAVKVA
jgi:hypothetical protein